jgi:hypothetical protein
MSIDANGHTVPFMRPLGVPVEAHEKLEDADFARRDALGMSLSLEERRDYREAIDLSLRAEAADEHLLNAVQLLRVAGFLPDEPQQSVLDEVATRIAMALRAIGERRLTARQGTRYEAAG